MMKVLKEVKRSMGQIIAKRIYREAEKSANSACVFIHGQPKMPEKVKKLNKIK
jgi:cyclic lactone autoinducer peptide